MVLGMAVALAVASNLLYHVSQKSIPPAAHPILSLLVTYAIAFAVTLALWPLYPGERPTWRGLSALNWSSVTVGIAIVGVEMGILLAYRAGLRVSVGATLVNVLVAALIVPIGVILFRESLTAANVAGLVLCAAGLWLLL